MGIHPNDVSTESLLEQAGWLTALARRLVRDPAEADDVAQETMLAALSSDRPAPRRWLAHVARNIARARARSRTARTQREITRSVPPPAPSSADLAEKLEAQRLLVEAVRDLDEPYRRAILLHYWEHKTSEEIAALENTASSTVRWRLKQGVDELRRRLDAKHGGDRRAWSVMLVPLVKTTSAGTVASTSVVTGVLGMKLHTVITALVLVVLGVGTWMTTRALRSGPSPSTPHAAPAAELAKVGRQPPAVDTLDPATTAVAQRSSALSPPSGSPNWTHSEDGIARIEARVVDETHEPIAGATVSFSRAKSTPASDHDGRLVVEADLHAEETVTESLEFKAHDRATRTLSTNLQRSRTTYLGDVVLKPGGSVSGMIVDEAGKPVAGAEVGQEHDDRSFEEQLSGFGRSHINIESPRMNSAADGSFHLDGMPVGSQHLAARRPSKEIGWPMEPLPIGFGHPSDTAFSADFQVRWGQETSGIQITLPPARPERNVSAVVLDPDGAPVPHTSYVIETKRESGTGSQGSATDSNGRFKGTAAAEGQTEVYARDDKGRWEDTPHVLLHDGDNDVTLRFTTSRKMLELAVTDEKDVPLEHWSGACRSLDDQNGIMDLPRGTHVGGICRVGLPDVPFLLVVEAAGHARTKLGPFDPATLGPALTVVLHTETGIRGRVVDAAGPVGHARVRLFREASGCIDVNGFVSGTESNARDTVVTRDDGTFQLTPRENGRYVARADSAGYAPAEALGLSVDVDRGISDLVLVLSAGGAIEGRVLTGPGIDPTGSIVAISRGDPFSVTQRVGPDGSFSFQHLIPGRWMVSSTDKELREGQDSTTTLGGLRPKPPSNCEVFEGQTTRFDLDRREASRSCVLLGELDFRGSSNNTWTVTFVGGDPLGAPPARLSWWGHQFRLATNTPGATNILFTATGGDVGGTILTAPVVLKVGETHWQLTVDQATLELRGDGSRSDPNIPLVLVTPCDDGSTFVRPLLGKGDTSSEVPAGKGRILWLDETVRRDEDARTWTGGVEVTLEPRATVRIERP